MDARHGRRSPPGEVAQVHGIIVELLNSAIEWTIDYISTAHHPMAKRAKDMASAAVFLGYVNCVVVWGHHHLLQLAPHRAAGIPPVGTSVCP